MSQSDTIDVRRMRQALAGQAIGGTIEHHEEIGSTNDRVRELIGAGHGHGAVVLAEHQSTGRGRRGATWCGTPGRDLLMSVLLRPPPGATPTRITLLAALALAEAVNEATGLAARVKWPNDLWLDGRKLAGVLCESCDDAVVLGMGCNVNSLAGERPAEVAALAVSLREATPDRRWWNRGALAAAVLRRLQAWWPAVSDAAHGLATGSADGGSHWGRARARLAALAVFQPGCWVEATLAQSTLRGRVEELGNEGQLRLLDASGLRHELYQVERIRPLEAGSGREVTWA